MERKDGNPCLHGEPERPRLDLVDRAHGSVGRKTHRPAGGQMALELKEGLGRAPAAGSSGRKVPEPANDAGYVLPVGVLAGDHADLPESPEMGGAKDLVVPEAEDDGGASAF